MDDSTLDRELEALLSTDPAPGFRARLRQRIAQQPPLQTRPRGWQIAPLAIGSAVVIGVVVMLIARGDGPTGSPAGQGGASPPLASQQVDGSLHRAMARRVGPTYLPRATREPSAVAPRSMRRSSPAVVVDAREAAAWRSLLRNAHDGLPLLSASGDRTVAPLPEGFTLPPVVIEPITPAFDEEGVHP